MPFTLIRQDITKLHVDAIVNAANTELVMGGGVCGAIFQAAGARELQAACDRLAPIRTGQAVITPGFALPCRYVIHAVGPVYAHWSAEQSERLLRSAYLESLRLAREQGCASIAFPLISSGIYGYPKDQALQAAVAAIEAFLADAEMDVYLAVFDSAAFAAGKTLLGRVESYIGAHYVKEHRVRRGELLKRGETAGADDSMLHPNARPMDLCLAPEAAGSDLASRFGALDEPFQTALFRLIDQKGKTDVEVYKRANLDRKLFSKIRSGKNYTPGKRTILALAVALELTLPETDDLLRRAGYALSHSQKFDVIVEYFILSQSYDVLTINEILFQYDQPLLGG